METTETKTTSAKPKKKRDTKSFIIEFAIKIVLTGLAIWLFCGVFCGVYVNHSNSSDPMVKDGDLVIIYRLGEVQKDDVVLIKTKSGIKFQRVVALGGDTVEIENGTLSVNGYIQKESESFSEKYSCKVPEGSVFLLNDNLSDKSDSRKNGAVSDNDIKGKIIFLMRRRGI